jgi:hypothetical protein|tara:strand:- start:97 stop:327 length:231 start_codon:yes stop_codon:yes gene_type:complete
MKTSEIIEILKLAEQGEVIEWRTRGSIYHGTDMGWTEVVHVWNFVEFDYRVQPKPIKIPLTIEEIEQRLGYPITIV